MSKHTKKFTRVFSCRPHPMSLVANDFIHHLGIHSSHSFLLKLLLSLLLFLPFLSLFSDILFALIPLIRSKNTLSMWPRVSADVSRYNRPHSPALLRACSTRTCLGSSKSDLLPVMSNGILSSSSLMWRICSLNSAVAVNSSCTIIENTRRKPSPLQKQLSPMAAESPVQRCPEYLSRLPHRELLSFCNCQLW